MRFMNANRLVAGSILGFSLPLLGGAAEPAAPSPPPPSFGSVLDTGHHVYEGVNVIRVTPTHLFFRHSRGITSLPISQLPPEVRVQVEGRIPQPKSSQTPSAAPAAKPSPPPEPLPREQKQIPRTPPIRTRPLWILYPIQNTNPSPLGTGTCPGPRGLPPNWFLVHPSVYPQSLMNPDWRRLAERDFFITAARNNPALLTRQIVSGWR